MSRVVNFPSNARKLSFDKAHVAELVNGKSVLITGGTGSFGKRCAEMLLKEFSPAKVIIFSRDELKQHEMKVGGLDDARIRYFIGDIRDRERLLRAMHGVNFVVHAAALKQVPACEYNPMEAILTNIIGTRNVIEAALDAKVQRTISLSTDKAVNPINLYGATKLCGEKLMAQSNSYAGTSPTRFASVRYGNVVGSRGSVIPVFLKQRETGTVTITDERMTRFWLNLDQGVRFVLDCLVSMRGGEVFVPKIPSMKVMDLAKVIAPNCKIDFVGIRQGEKLHEMLVSEDEARNTKELEDRFIIEPTQILWKKSEPAEFKTLAEGEHFSSDNNTWWLTPDDLKNLVLESVEAPANAAKNAKTHRG